LKPCPVPLCRNLKGDDKQRLRDACRCWIKGKMPGEHYAGCRLAIPSPRQLRDAANRPWEE